MCETNIFLYCVDMKCDTFNVFLTNIDYIYAYLANGKHYSLQNELWDRFTELRTFTSDITFKICIKYVFINNLFHFDVIQQ
jgi:hypothetical protein